MQRISARKEYVLWIDQKFVVARRTIDNVLGKVENSSYTNTFKVELEADRQYLSH